ncbi:MAG: FeoA domain-containing protein [Oligoflexia bacterium]|nr:FeoA domain-containing protein [Oligoflexia bacterium]
MTISTLGKLRRGQSGMIVSVKTLETRLLEIGFLEGSHVEIVHEAPWGKDPIVVRVRGALIALRRQEADLVEVEIQS